jgi:hypothetical protein
VASSPILIANLSLISLLKPAIDIFSPVDQLQFLSCNKPNIEVDLLWMDWKIMHELGWRGLKLSNRLL